MENPTPANLRYAWYVVFVLMLANVSSFIDRQILALHRRFFTDSVFHDEKMIKYSIMALYVVAVWQRRFSIRWH